MISLLFETVFVLVKNLIILLPSRIFAVAHGQKFFENIELKDFIVGSLVWTIIIVSLFSFNLYGL